jgi:galactokinase
LLTQPNPHPQATRRARALLFEKWQPRLSGGRTTGETTVFTRAPGRLNLIGEHVDYNGGFVMPVAVDRAVYVAALPREDRLVRIWSDTTGEGAEFSLDRLREKRPDWARYLQAVAWALDELGLPLRGMDAAIYSDVPAGAGLSSSAALEVAWALAMLQLAHRDLPPQQLALTCQRAENEYVGMRCGILDQFASVFGKAGTALLIDCESREMQTVPMRGRPLALVVCDTNQPRQLADSEYNKRRASCEAAAKILGVPSLRQATMETVTAARELLGEENFRRAWHVVTENERVLETARAFERGDLDRVGQLVSASHKSLRDFYEVSCPELEIMWAATQRIGCYGSRLVGAGFGGAVLALVAPEETGQFVRRVAEEYQAEAGKTPNVFPVQIADGAGVLET